MSDITAAELRKLLREAEEREEIAATETPRSRTLADLDDHRVHPLALAAELRRIHHALDLLGIDIDGAEPGDAPTLRKTKTKTKSATSDGDAKTEEVPA